jgi:hypothetical protein
MKSNKADKNTNVRIKSNVRIIKSSANPLKSNIQTMTGEFLYDKKALIEQKLGQSTFDKRQIERNFSKEQIREFRASVPCCVCQKTDPCTCAEDYLSKNK